MRLLSNRFYRRGFSVFFLVLFVHSLFTPFYALALTSGPHQPEFTSYEDAGSTDMVNLSTGDFNFNIPIIDVPGPEGNFSLPLSYHAGIGLEQEASWTGLGWNINAGAILRNVNQYPDDASGEGNQVIVQDLTGVTGWNRMFNHPFRDDWNSQTGYHGNVNLLDIVEVDFGSMSSVGIVGVHVGDGGVSFDAVQFTMAVINLVSWGVGSAGTTAASVAKQAAVDLAIGTAVSFAMPVNTPGSPSGGNYKYSKSTSASGKFHKEASVIATILTSTPFPIFSRKKSYKIWLDQSRTEDMYGVLNLGDANQNLVDVNESTVSLNNGQPQILKRFSDDASDRGAASDMNFTIDDNVPYPQHSSPNVLATDSYTVNAPGVSGSITPYRLDIGSLSMPRQMSEFHMRLAPLPYLNNYKVPFIYEGSLFNQHFYHVGGLTTPTSPSFHYGLGLDATISFPFNSTFHF
ncbi:MAG: hypothetical protein C0490_19695, partial [Marivirga sp.]|nr:hypothetical protein [Marivirga sp.]